MYDSGSVQSIRVTWHFSWSEDFLIVDCGGPQKPPSLLSPKFVFAHIICAHFAYKMYGTEKN